MTRYNKKKEGHSRAMSLLLLQKKLKINKIK